jgi:hypothetical protein
MPFSRLCAETDGMSRTSMRCLDQDSLHDLRLDQLRLAIRLNTVTFPSQVPGFEKHGRADLQWKLAQLYFIRGWNCAGIGAKFGLLHRRVRQILNSWKARAIATGFIQPIPPPEVATQSGSPVILEQVR